MAKKPFDKGSTKKTNTERRAQKPGSRKSSDNAESSSKEKKTTSGSERRKPSGSAYSGEPKRSFSKDKENTGKKRTGAPDKKYFKREGAGFKKEDRREGFSNDKDNKKRPFEKREKSSYSDKKPGARSNSSFKSNSNDFEKGSRPRSSASGKDFEKPRFERKDTFRSTTNLDDFEKKPAKPQNTEEFKPKGRYSDEKLHEKPVRKTFGKTEDKRSSRDAEPREKNFDSFDKNSRTTSRKTGERENEKPPFKRSFDKAERTEKAPYKKSFERTDRKDKPSAFDRDDKKDKTAIKRSFDTNNENDGKPRNSEGSSFSKSKSPKVSSFKKNNADNKPDFEIPRYDLSKVKKKKSEEPDKDGRIRLNKYIANAGVCSRREADQIIEDGLIKVNGKVVTEMGYQVSPGDTVKYGSKILNAERQVYILLNKPKDFITTTDDPEDRKTVMQLVANACKERVYPVGRLDRNTTGLLLLTNDGELAKKLTHPSHEVKKVYQAELDKPITKEDMARLEEGVELEDGPVHIHDLAQIDKKIVGLEIHEGRNRIVRRLFEHLGYEVVYLDRVVYAGLTKKDLPRGHWRFLTEKEVIKLKFFL